MFYPVESLKKGGKFYLCWVADSWPLRFATITHRELWSREQDVRKLCDDLMGVVTNESGRPVKRFSLRLSSQLMRGLVRLYQKKVNVFLGNLCMINANVTKHANKKYNIPEVSELQRARQSLQDAQQLPQITLPEAEEEIEQRIEEIFQNSGNVVSHIENITLKEATLPEFQLPPNDNFGEENPDQALQLLGDRTEELIRDPADPSNHSRFDIDQDITVKSHDRTLYDRPLESASLLEVTSVSRKSNAVEFNTGGEFEKEIQIPEIPIIHPQEQMPLEPEIVEGREEPVNEVPERIPAIRESEEIELEELEDEPQAKRRRLKKILIDKKIKLSANVLRARIDNPNVELRCQDSSDDIVEIRVSCEDYFRRPCHAGAFQRSNLGTEITRLFMRNLGVIQRPPRAEREFQGEMMHIPQRTHTRSMLERIDEVVEPVTETANITENITHPKIPVQDATLSEPMVQVDIAEILTQKIDTVSQQSRKRKTVHENILTPKKQRSIGYVSFRESQQNRQTEMEVTLPIASERTLVDKEADKENVPENMQDIAEGIQTDRPSKEAEKSVAAMLQEAGLADIQTYQPQDEHVVSQRKSSKRQGSEGSETPLGSLDRTKVSLGDSEQTTDSKRFIRDHWGTEGTMVKILKSIRNKSTPVTVSSLINIGPLIPGYKAMIAARCFTSILKLKQHGFAAIVKNPETLEIENIELGPKFA